MYQIKFENSANYIAATVTGINSPDVVSQYLEEIRAECKRRNCFSVLINVKLEGPRLGVMDIFSLVSEGSMKVRGLFEAIAWSTREWENWPNLPRRSRQSRHANRDVR